MILISSPIPSLSIENRRHRGGWHTRINVSSTVTPTPAAPYNPSMPSDQELRDLTEGFKEKGNEAFQKSHLDDAILAYSQGLVQVDRIVAPPSTSLKATLLSNRAACYLKQGKLTECQEDCTSSLALLEKENDGNDLRSKLLYRRAKALFLKANMPHKKQEDDLNLAAKDLLTLLSFDSGNKDATHLLNTIRAQHGAETKNNGGNSPITKTLREVEKKDDKLMHNIKVLLGLLTSDSVSSSMELGRRMGVKILFDVASGSTGTSNKEGDSLKVRKLALQCLSCAGSHPPFCRGFLKDPDIQTKLGEIIAEACANPYDQAEVAVGAWTVYLRLILHLDRDDPNQEIQGKTDLLIDPLINALIASFQSANSTIIRAAIDVLSTWTAGKDRELVIRASLDNNLVDLPVPLSKYEMHQLKPRELSDYKQRLYQKKTRDQAWAFERSSRFCHGGGLQEVLNFTVSHDDSNLRREITAVLAKLLAALADDDKIQAVAKPIFGTVDKETEDERTDGKTSGVIIEEINEDDDAEEGKVVDAVDSDDKKRAAEVSIEVMKQRAELATALLMANGDIGGWAMGSGWPQCTANLIAMVNSDDLIALRIVAELLSSAASVKGTRPIVSSYLTNEAMKPLVTHTDRNVRTAAASAVAKLGLAEDHTQDFELMSLLEAAFFMLEEGEESVELLTASGNSGANAPSSKVSLPSGAKTSVERGVEVVTYLITKTLVKQEICHGFKATTESKYTGLELLVKVSDNAAAGENVMAFGIASIFQLMAATPLTLRKEAFEGREITMEQFDEIQKMQKTQEQKETDDDTEIKEDSDEQCAERIVKMVNSNVPRALIQLMDGASDQTLEQIVTALNRLAAAQSVRGTMIQQGVLTALIKIEREEINPTDIRKKIVRNIRHCMAKLLVTTNPSLLTSAQSMGAVKPLIQLVREVESTDLQKFEALLSLTNLASMGDSTKSKIAAEKGLSTIKFAMFSDHPMVKKAATECLCNMVGNEAFMKMLQDVEELRLWLALAADFEDHYECARAAAGCLAMATGDPAVAETLIQIPKFKERMDACLESGSLEIIHRMMVVILNLLELDIEKLKEAAVENGLVAFCNAYVDSYKDGGSKTTELQFEGDELVAFNATVEVAKQVVKASER